MPKDQANKMRIEADPTKDLFIGMLVKDIPLIRAMIDLVDNSVDGAKRIRPRGNYEGLFVRLVAAADKFEIRDNCGGIPVRIAREYAFRFGRPSDMPTKLQTVHSVGQFGVGMKRAIFKMGRKFQVVSSTTTSEFEMNEDVDKWKDKEEWDFRFTRLSEGVKIGKEAGTKISITRLLDAVATELPSDTFLNQLDRELSAAHQISIGRGLEISLNGKKIAHRPATLYSSPSIRPGKKKATKREKGGSVDIVLYAGIFESKPDEGGWYVFCNERLVLRADQSIVTGWGQGKKSGAPKYHNQFARFRGYAFLDSDHPSLLPWNTTKTGVDADSVLYQGVRTEMLIQMQPVIKLLNEIHNEIKRTKKPLQSLVEKLDGDPKSSVRLSEIKRVGAFVWPTPQQRPPKTDLIEIKYKREKEKVERLKKFLGVRKASEVGERTFDDRYELECED